ncbi:MAG TPA: ABC transporter substrate-binding protein [Solirubrobacterales bacterium]|nr:ABC transporter substrate-binding protein [Solirubrobacterales bacterium]
MLTISGYRGPETAGLFMAAARGYFADEGLDIDIYKPWTPLRPVKYVVEGTADLSISHQPQVVLAKANGAPIEAVGSLISQPTATLIWLGKSRVRSIRDLKGKIVGIPGLSFQESLLLGILARAGLTRGDVCISTVKYALVKSLVNHQVDAIFGGSWYVEGRQIQSRGLQPIIKRVSDLGIPAYEELVFIARTDFAARHAEMIRDFMSALRRGTAAAGADPQGAAKAIGQSEETNRELSLGEMEVGIETTLPLLSKSGYMEPLRAKRLIDWMAREGLIKQAPAASQVQTNRYLARR